MDLSQAQHAGPPIGHLVVNGQRSIKMIDHAPFKMSSPSKLYYYRGVVRSGSLDDQLSACSVIIFKYDGSEDAKELHNQLCQIDHPCVIKTLGFAAGVGVHINCTFLSLLPFDTTFATYLQKNGPGVDINGRFTLDFISLMNDIIDGLEELHKLGYYCPDLKGDDIAVIKQSGSMSAKIWNFDQCLPEMGDKEKDGDWFRLGFLLVSMARTDEVSDLLKDINSGQLKGKSIMKHSALLTVRKKFENVLSFYLHISLHCEQKPNPKETSSGLKVSELCAANLESNLDRRLGWTTPAWTQGVKRGLPISTKTLRGFVNQVRIFIEHEIFFIPEEMTRSLTYKEISDGKTVKDLEHHLQGSCGEIFRAVQRLVAELNLEY